MFSADDFKKEVSADDPNEIAKYFEEHKEDFRAPPQINVSYFLLAYPPQPTDETKAQTVKTSQTLADDVVLAKNFEDLAKKYNLSVAQTGFFSVQEPGKITLPFEVLQKVLELSENEIGGPFETPQGFYAAQIKEKKDCYLPALADIQDKVKESAILLKAKEAAHTKAQDLHENLEKLVKENPQKDFQQIVQGLDLKTNQTPAFKRGEYIPQIGISKEFQEASFALSKEKPLSAPIEIPKGNCLLYFGSLTPIDEAQFQKEKDEFIKTLTENRKNEAFMDFFSDLRLKANLLDHISNLKKIKL